MAMNFDFNPSKLDADVEISKKNLRDFYLNILSLYFGNSQISKVKKKITAEKYESKFKSDRPLHQLFFLHSFGFQDTYLSETQLYESCYPLIVQKFSSKNSMKLLCLESESLPVVIGVCRLINEIAANKILDLREIQILLIETRQKWRDLSRFLVNVINSDYFRRIKLTLDFVDNFTSLSSQELSEIDLVIVARIFTVHRTFHENYSAMQIVLNGMAENAVLYYFDSFNERYYSDLASLVSENGSFSQITSKSFLDVPQVKNDVFCDNDFQPVVFSIWKKDYPLGMPKVIASDHLNLTNLPRKSCDVKAPSSESTTKLAAHSNNEDDLLSSTQTDISKTAKISDHSVSATEQKNVTEATRKKNKEKQKVESFKKEKVVESSKKGKKVESSKGKNKVESSKESSKTKTDTETTASNMNWNPRTNKKKASAPPAVLTKKTIKHNVAEKVKLNGRFAHMDLEKKNKDQRHKIRAKNASFDKYSDFGYDDW